MRRFGCSLPTPMIVGFLLLAGASAAQVPITFPYVDGNVGFHYQQWPFGPYAGDFQATGVQFEDPPGPGAFDQAVPLGVTAGGGARSLSSRRLVCSGRAFGAGPWRGRRPGIGRAGPGVGIPVRAAHGLEQPRLEPKG